VAAEKLMVLAIILQTHLMEKLNTLSPSVAVKRSRGTVAGAKGSSYRVYTDPSKPGEYLKKRTGWLQGHIVLAPATKEEVAKAGYIRVGYSVSAFYGAIWERKPPRQKRKGLLDALEEVRPQLMRMMGKT
jgi:hypothetical protein